MQAGKLRHRVTIEQLVTGSPDRAGSGAQDTSWLTFRTCWAAIEPLSGKEYFAADAVQSEIKVRIRIRYVAGVLPSMRVLHGSTAYTIEAIINPQTRNIELLLMCSQGVQHG